MGGIIRIVNGCTVDAGRVTDVRLPAHWLARFQVVEYLRAFLAGRVAMSAMNCLLIVSGAFGLFRRDAVVRAGGFRADTIGEDMDIIVRLHRLMRQQETPYRIVFQPDPVCWTEVPESAAILENQRNRWHRGTLQVLTAQAQMIGSARYGAVGMFAMPYFAIFEAASPLVETFGYLLNGSALLFGLVDVVFAQLFFLMAIAFGALISVLAVLLEEVSFRRYPRTRDLLMLVAIGVLENFGYRQLTAGMGPHGAKGVCGAMTGIMAPTPEAVHPDPCGPAGWIGMERARHRGRLCEVGAQPGARGLRRPAASSLADARARHRLRRRAQRRAARHDRHARHRHGPVVADAPCGGGTGSRRRSAPRPGPDGRAAGPQQKRGPRGRARHLEPGALRARVPARPRRGRPRGDHRSGAVRVHLLSPHPALECDTGHR
jgi:hypothetical protein